MSVLDKLAEKWHIDRRRTRIPLLHKATLTEKKSNFGWVFVLPFAIGMLLIYLPILLDSVWFSFSKIIKTEQWIDGEQIFITVVENQGLQYYKAALNTNFLSTLVSGFEQLVLNVPAILIFALFIAVILNQKMVGRAAFRAIFFIPVILATGLMESINATDILAGAGGVDDGTGGTVGLMAILDVEALFSNMKVGTELVTYVVGLVNRIYSIINYSGVQMLIFLAGLQSISPSIYEACQIEGATSWETFWKITLPMISPMILVNGIYTIIDSFTRHDNIVMNFINRIYSQGGENTMIATAQSWMYFIMVLLVIAAFAGLASIFVFYQKRD